MHDSKHGDAHSFAAQGTANRETATRANGARLVRNTLDPGMIKGEVKSSAAVRREEKEQVGERAEPSRTSKAD